MYEAFYGFREKPFSLNPDPSFLFMSRKHSVGLSMLEYGFANQAGICVLTGEIGSGKTTLIRRLLDGVGEKVTVGLISNTHRSFGNLMQWVSTAFGLPAKASSKPVLYDRLVRFLVDEYAAGRHSVLVVDEAQNLDVQTLEELRLLSNLNADKHQVLQLVLVGQPELRSTLRSPALVQFVQRIGVDFHLQPLAAEETGAYIAHRLTVANGDSALFTPTAARFIHYQTGGVPRMINSMCDTALVYGFAESLPRIDARLVHDMLCERLREGLFGAGIIDRGDIPVEQLVATAGQNLARAALDMNDVPPAANVA